VLMGRFNFAFMRVLY
ncbi:hypothetical protein D030_2792B, partial [Vibrio parahaemolyticus AQ3810]